MLQGEVARILAAGSDDKREEDFLRVATSLGATAAAKGLGTAVRRASGRAASTPTPPAAPAPVTPAPSSGLPRPAKWSIYGVIAALVGVLAWSQLPRGPYSTDLSRIGQGRPAVVLAYDIQTMGGMEVMAMMDTLRPNYRDRVEFLVAALGAPEGQAFGQRHRAISGTVVLFSEAGIPVRTLRGPANAAELQQALEGLLAHGMPR